MVRGLVMRRSSGLPLKEIPIWRVNRIAALEDA
jgi:hypothetical protein